VRFHGFTRSARRQHAEAHGGNACAPDFHGRIVRLPRRGKGTRAGRPRPQRRMSIP
jgi:hypothetical protein